MKAGLAVVVALGLGGCVPAADAVGDLAESALPPPKVVLPAAKVDTPHIGDTPYTVEPPYWTAAKADVQSAEAQLPEALRAAPVPAGGSAPLDLREYGRQYIGGTYQGRRTLVVNGFCQGWAGRDLKRAVFRMADGGSCYFAAYYDVQQRRFVEIAFNAAG